MNINRFFWKIFLVFFVVVTIINLSFYSYVNLEVRREKLSRIEKNLKELGIFLEKYQKAIFPVIAKETTIVTIEKLPEKLIVDTEKNDVYYEPQEKFSYIYVKINPEYFIRYKVYYEDFFDEVSETSEDIEFVEDKPQDGVFCLISVFGRSFYLRYKKGVDFGHIEYFLTAQLLFFVIAILILVKYISQKFKEGIVKPLTEFAAHLEGDLSDIYIPSSPDLLEEFEEVRMRINEVVRKLHDKYEICNKRFSSLVLGVKVMTDTLFDMVKSMELEDLRMKVRKILEIIVENLEIYDGGSVYIRKGGYSYFLTAVGFDENYLVGLKLPPYNAHDVIAVDWKVVENALRLPEDVRKRFKRAGSDSIRISVFAPITYGGKIVGELWLDSFRYDTVKKHDLYAAKFFAHIISLIWHEDYSLENQKKIFTRTLSEIASFAEYRKPYLKLGHSKEMAKDAVIIGKLLKLPEEDLELLELSALLHDIGKVAIPQESYRMEIEEDIKRHVNISHEIIEKVSGLERVAECVLYHHENWDGSGYPYGVKGENIPVCSRILAVLNTYDYLIRDKIVGETLPYKDAIEYLKKNKGVLFDPEIVEAAVKYFEGKNTI